MYICNPMITKDVVPGSSLLAVIEGDKFLWSEDTEIGKDGFEAYSENYCMEKKSEAKCIFGHHTINTALALDKFFITPPLMHIKARLGGWGARRRR